MERSIAVVMAYIIDLALFTNQPVTCSFLFSLIEYVKEAKVDVQIERRNTFAE
jgi:hypothetical protein